MNPLPRAAQNSAIKQRVINQCDQTGRDQTRIANPLQWDGSCFAGFIFLRCICQLRHPRHKTITSELAIALRRVSALFGEKCRRTD
jgi:hypothetical protein